MGIPASIGGWQRVLDHAHKIGTFAGVDVRSYPRDFAVFARAHRDLARTRHLSPMPAQPFNLAEAEEYLGTRPEIDWTS
jgi:hypothetical protein